MENLDVFQGDFYAQKSKNRTDKKLLKELFEEFKDKPFNEEYAWLKRDSRIASYILDGISIASAYPFTLFLWSSCVSFLPNILGLILANVLSIGFLWYLQRITRKTACNFFKSWLKEKDITALNKFRAFRLVFICSASIFLSFKGSYEVPKLVTPPPAEKNAVLVDLAPTRLRYEKLIQSAIDNKNTFAQNNQCADGKGGTTLCFKRSIKKQYQKLTARITALEDQYNSKILELEALNNSRSEEAKNKNATALLNYESETKQQGSYIGYLNIICQVLILICFFFESLFKQKSAEHNGVFEIIETYNKHQKIAFENAVLGDFENAQEKAQSTQSFLSENTQSYPKKSPKNLPKASTSMTLGAITQSPKQNKKSPKKRILGEDIKLPLARISGNISTYKKAIERYTKEGKQHLVLDNKERLKYWESVKFKKQNNSGSLRIV